MLHTVVVKQNKKVRFLWTSVALGSGAEKEDATEDMQSSTLPSKPNKSLCSIIHVCVKECSSPRCKIIQIYANFVHRRHGLVPPMPSLNVGNLQCSHPGKHYSKTIPKKITSNQQLSNHALRAGNQNRRQQQGLKPAKRCKTAR